MISRFFLYDNLYIPKLRENHSIWICYLPPSYCSVGTFLFLFGYVSVYRYYITDIIYIHLSNWFFCLCLYIFEKKDPELRHIPPSTGHKIQSCRPSTNLSKKWLHYRNVPKLRSYSTRSTYVNVSYRTILSCIGYVSAHVNDTIIFDVCAVKFSSIYAR